MMAKKVFSFDVSKWKWKVRHWLICAVVAWLVFALPGSFAMPPALRVLTFSILTGAVFIAVIYELNKKETGRLSLIRSFALIWLAGTATLYLANRFSPREEEITGALVAGTASTPSTACGSGHPAISRNGLLMVFGRAGVIGQGDGPFVPVRIGTCPALSITRTPSGLMVNAFGFDSDDNVVYRIKDNKFEQVIGGFLKGHRPDRSTLLVSDNRGAEALAIRYLNRNAVQVWGTFRCGNTRPVRITDDLIAIGGIATKGRCAVIDHKNAFGIEYSDQGLHFSTRVQGGP